MLSGLLSTYEKYGILTPSIYENSTIYYKIIERNVIYF